MPISVKDFIKRLHQGPDEFDPNRDYSQGVPDGKEFTMDDVLPPPPSPIISKVPEKPRDPAAQPGPKAVPTVAPDTPPNVVKDTIAARTNYGYGPGLDADALRAAQGAANERIRSAQLNQAGADIGHAIARLPGKADTSYWDKEQELAQKGVTDLGQLRTATTQDKAEAERQLDEDPNSVKASIYRKTLAPLAIKVGMDPDVLKGFSLKDLKEFAVGPIEKMATLKSTEDLRKATLAATTQRSQSVAGQKADKAQSEAMSKVIDKIEATKSRGSVKNAWDAERLVQNAQSILDAYPDLNKMPQQQVALFVDELGKIARGGSATEGSQHALMPTSGTSAFQNALSKLGNAPKGADLGDFLKEYGHYLQDLKSNARSTIGQSIKSHVLAHKSKLSSSDMADLKDNYGEYLNPQVSPPRAPESAPLAPSGVVTTKPPGMPQDKWDRLLELRGQQ